MGTDPRSVDERGRWGWSIGDEGRFRCGSDSRAEALGELREALIDDSECSGEPSLEGSVGLGAPYPPLSQFLDPRLAIDSAIDSAASEFGDLTDGWGIGESTDEQIAELRASIDAWAERHGHSPRFSSMDHVEPVAFTLAELGLNEACERVEVSDDQ